MKNSKDNLKISNSLGDESKDIYGDWHNSNNSSAISDTDSDKDSSPSKYVVENDDRERRDGPGGN